jgi:hypothetical protein
VAEHLLQLGAEQIYAALQDEELKKELQCNLASDHLLVPILDAHNDYDQAIVAEALAKQENLG